MGFLRDNTSGSGKSSGLYLELTEQPKRFRPLRKAPESIWIHKIPGLSSIGPDGQPVTIRKFLTEICVSTGKSGAGCNPCTTIDPMWDKLDDKSKFNKKKARVDFPKSCTHLLPVTDAETGETRLLKGGNQLFEEMDKWYESQPDAGKDLRRCEWQAWKIGKGITTKYNTVRLDATPFTVTPELEAEAAAVLEKGRQDMAPMNLQAFVEAIHGGGNPTAQLNNTATVTLPAGLGLTVASGPALPPGLTTLEVRPSQFSATQPVKPVPAQPTPPANGVLEEFTVWVNQQPEFQGLGTFNNLIPVLQEKIGNVNYHGCTPDQLAMLKSALASKLDAIRAKKA